MVVTFAEGCKNKHTKPHHEEYDRNPCSLRSLKYLLSGLKRLQKKFVDLCPRGYWPQKGQSDTFLPSHEKKVFSQEITTGWPVGDYLGCPEH